MKIDGAWVEVAWKVRAKRSPAITASPPTPNLVPGVVVPTPTRPPEGWSWRSPLETICIAFLAATESQIAKASEAFLPRSHFDAPASWKSKSACPVLDVSFTVTNGVAPETVSTEVGFAVPTPTYPFALMARDGMVVVVKFEGDEVAKKRLPMIERNVHGFDVAEPSVSASCGAVDDESVRVKRGEVVPIPTTAFTRLV